MYKKIIVLFLALALIFAFSGCSSLFKKAAEEATGVKVDKDGNSVKVKTKDGEAEISGNDNELPDDFPEKFPIYDGVDIKSSSKISTDKGTGYYVTLETEDSVDDVTAFYKKELPDNGYKTTSTMETNKGTSFTFKDGYVTITEQDSTTQIGISLTVK